jgi:hypothetical protein
MIPDIMGAHTVNTQKANVRIPKPEYQDLFQKPQMIDDRMKFAVNVGTIIVRLLDKMAMNPAAAEAVFGLGGSNGQEFELVVRRKAK